MRMLPAVLLALLFTFTGCSRGAIDEDGDGWTPNDGDCDDTRAWVWPGAQEVCDGVDNNCDGNLMPGELTDNDDDGYSTCFDCEDWMPNIPAEDPCPE